MMKRKSEVGRMFARYLEEECDPLGVVVEVVQTDGAGEYTGAATPFVKVCVERKIARRTDSPYCHWEMGAAERVIRTMAEKSFSVLAARDLPAAYWALCLAHVYMVVNMLPHAAFGDKESPYMRWHEKRPKLRWLRTFGCDVRVAIPRDHPKRVKYTQPPGYMGIYVGEKRDSSAHLVYRPGSAGQSGQVEDVGDRLCVFFEHFDPNCYLKPHEDESYREYFRGETFRGPTRINGTGGAESAAGSSASPFRICKRFDKGLYYGTAVRNLEAGAFCIDVVYDDGDTETMTEGESDQCVRLFAESSTGDPRSQSVTEARTYSVIANGVRVLEVLDHKFHVTSFNNVMSLLNIKYTPRGEEKSRTAWVSAGALLKSCENFDELYGMLREYCENCYHVDGDESRYREELFKFVRLDGARRGRDVISAKTAELSLFVYEYDPDSEVLFTVAADRRKLIQRPADRFVAMSATTSLVVPDDCRQVPKNYLECLKSALPQWLNATENCVDAFAMADIGDWVH
jgi:hypothetical protein